MPTCFPGKNCGDSDSQQVIAEVSLVNASIRRS
jgi:hypothetical protein